MIAIYLGAPSPLATQIGVGRRVRCPNKNRANLTLDKWGFALLVGQEPRGSTDSWRSHHDAVAHVIYGDATTAGIEGRNKAYSRASYPPQTPAATGRSGTAWSRTRCCDARRSPTPCTRITYTT